MAREKIKFALRIAPETQQLVKDLCARDNCQSQNEFIEKAIRFYAGYVSSGEAIDYLEQVRARARGTNTNILPKVTTTDQGELREAIRHERRVELGMEFDRFYDLVRWGIAKEVLHAAGKVNYQDKNALLPLPQTEIDKSKGVLVQNPDY